MNWKASWIFDKKEFDNSKRSVLFRKKIVLEQVPDSAEIMISADSRYRLYVNGEAVCCGPLKSNPYRRYYETCDISPFLSEGENVLAVQVLRFSVDYFTDADFANGPISLMNGSRGGLIVHGVNLPVDTDESWKVKSDPSYHFVFSKESRYAGDMEFVDGTCYPNGWNTAGYDDADWEQAVILYPSVSCRTGGMIYEWQLTPRPIPLLTEEETTPVRISRQAPGTDWEEVLRKNELRIPPHTECYADFDMGELSTCYPELSLKAGEGADIALMYGECYLETEESTGKRVKRDRNNSRAGELCGEEDHYRKGKGEQSFRPFFYRTFRYLRLTVRTGEEELVLAGLRCFMTGYPLPIQTRLTAADPRVQEMWDISVRTLLRCMHETYEDCPYYEQMQYIMDTGIQIAQDCCLSSDDKMARKALYDFAASQRPDGMLLCNYPASFHQIIPGFALFYPDMLLRLYRYTGDKELLSDYFPVVLKLLQYFKVRICRETGLVREAGYWEFVDWVEEWMDRWGSPAGEGEPYNFIYSQMYAWALLTTSEICEELGYHDLQEEMKRRHADITAAINRHAFDPESGLYLAAPGDKRLCQHAQLWAVLAECVAGSRAEELMRQCLDRKDLLPCSYSSSFYLFRALYKAGIYRESGVLWKRWKDMLRFGITTWPEDDVTQRSDCHAWSALPVCEIVSHSLGIMPDLPGYRRIRIEPCEFGLGDMEAEVVTKAGMVYVSRKIRKKRREGKEEIWAFYHYRFAGKVSLFVKLPEEEYETETDELTLEFRAGEADL